MGILFGSFVTYKVTRPFSAFANSSNLLKPGTILGRVNWLRGSPLSVESKRALQIDT